MVKVKINNDRKVFGRKFLLYFNTAIICISSFAIIGWLFNIIFLKTILLSSVNVKIIEAFALIMASITLILYKSNNENPLSQIFKVSLLWFVFLVGIISLLSHSLFSALDLDKILFGKFISYENGQYLRVISPTTALGFTLLSLSLYFLNFKKLIWLSHSLLSIIFFISLFALIGYFFGIEHFHGIFTDIPMSFHSSASLSFMSISALLITPNKGLGKILFNKGITGKHFRNTLAIIVVIPIVSFELFKFFGLASNLEYEITLYTIIIILSSLVGLIINSKLVLKTEELINELKEEDKQLSTIVNNAQEIIATCTPEGDITFINPAGKRMLALEPDEHIPSLNVSNFLNKNDNYKIFYEKIPEAIKNNYSEFTCSVINRDEVVIPVSVSFISHKSIDGTTDYISIIARDISEKQIAQLALLRSEKKYRSLFEKNKAGVYESTIDGGVINCNKAFVDMFGYTSKEELLSTLGVNFHQNEEARKKFLELLLKEKTLLNFETKTKRKDGSLIWTLENVLIINDNIIQGTIIDITDYKNTLFKLEQAVELNESLVQTIPFGMDIVDMDGNILFMNEVLKNTIGLSQPKGKCWDYYKDDKKQCLNCPLNQDLAKNKITVFEVSDTLGGRDFEITHKRMIYNGKEAMLEIFRDVTEIKKARQALIEAKEKAEEMNTLKNTFLANMSHELRTPMIGILGFAEAIADETDNSEHKEMASAIFESGKQLEETLNSILDLSKIEANKYELQKKSINIVNIINKVVKSYSAVAKGKSLTLKANIKDDEIFTLADESLLIHMLNNLVNNALKFTQKGEIEVGLSVLENVTENYVDVYVRDTGIGISEANLTKIFEEFRQVSEGESREYTGTGLGLTLVKKFTSLMDGEVLVKSKLGEGSTFTIRLNTSKQYENDKTKISEAQKKIKEKLPTISKVPQILYVEDDPNSRMVVGLFLKNNFDVSIVENAVTALDLTKSKMFDLILMDINLGFGMNGLDLAIEIKKNKKYKEIPIAAVTANAMVGDKRKYLNNGCTHYIAKPFNKSTLLSFISAILD